MQPLVSVIIPTYSRPTYLKRAVESVLNQTYKNIEIIVVDDNDPDTEARIETQNIMKELAAHPCITYLKHQHNKNGSAARNTGWRNAKGKYITFLDDDDEIADTKIERQVECLETLDDFWGCCYTAYRLEKENGAYQVSSEHRSGYLYVEALMRTMFMGSGSNLLLRKSVVDEINGYDESFKRNQDIEFLARVLEKYKIAYIDEPLLLIHQEGGRVRRTFDESEGYTKHYLDVFKSRLDALSPHDRKRVMTVISLERARLAFQMGLKDRAIKIIKEEKIGTMPLIRYVTYLLHRKITHKSYGFSL